jgi:hypothetical protein
MKAYRQRDLDAFAGHIKWVKEQWRAAARVEFERHGDKGSCIMGDGIAVMLIPPRCRTPRRHLIIDSREVASCQGSLHYEAVAGDAVRALQAFEIECFYHYGVMD